LRQPGTKERVRGALLFLSFVIGATWAVILLVAIIVLISQGTLHHDDIKQLVFVLIGTAAMFAVFVTAFEIYDWIKDATDSSRRRRWERRRRGRAHSPSSDDPREIELLTELTPPEWARLRDRMAATVRWWTIRRLIAAPFVALWSAVIAVLGVAFINQFLPFVVAVSIVVLVVAATVVVRLMTTAADTSSHSGDPLVIIGQVIVPVAPHRIEIGGEANTRAALRGASRGRNRLLEIEIRAALAIRATGKLEPAPKWQGVQRIPVGFRASRQLYAKEHVVLVCSAQGWVGWRLNRLVAETRLNPRSRDTSSLGRRHASIASADR
jgi:hypothetical protein